MNKVVAKQRKPKWEWNENVRGLPIAKGFAQLLGNNGDS